MKHTEMAQSGTDHLFGADSLSESDGEQDGLMENVFGEHLSSSESEGTERPQNAQQPVSLKVRPEGPVSIVSFPEDAFEGFPVGSQLVLLKLPQSIKLEDGKMPDTKLIYWSDNSVQLLVDDVPFDVTKSKFAFSSLHHVYEDLGDTKRLSGVLDSKMTVRPVSLMGTSSKLKAMHKLTTRQSKVKVNFEKRDLEKERLEELMYKKSLLEEQRKRKREEHTFSSDAVRYSRFLEDNESDESDAMELVRDDSEDDERIALAKESIQKGSAVVRPRMASEEEESEEEEDVQVSLQKLSKRRHVLDEDSE